MLHQAQKEIVQDLHRYRILVCGRKFGKTTLAAEEIAGCAISRKDQRILYIAPTLEDSRRLMWDRLKKKLGGAILKTNDTRLEIKVKTVDGGVSDIFLGSWEKVQNYRGDEFDFIVPDETQDYREFWVGWNEALGPTLTPRKGSALFMGTPKGFNHFYDLFYTVDPDFKSFKFTSYDNPFVDPEEINNVKRRISEDQFAQEYLADFRKTQGLVYKEFDRGRHIYKGETPDGMQLGGADPGFVFAAGVIGAVKDRDGVYWVNSEWVKTGRTDAQIAEYVKTCQFQRVFPDPENQGFIEEMRMRNVPIAEVKKGKGSVAYGINKVREMLVQGRLKIHPSCQNLIDGFESWNYGDSDAENPAEHEPDALAALRYLIMTDALIGPEDNRAEQMRIHEIRQERQQNELI